jgi:hypothetical protein
VRCKFCKNASKFDVFSAVAPVHFLLTKMKSAPKTQQSPASSPTVFLRPCASQSKKQSCVWVSAPVAVCSCF